MSNLLRALANRCTPKIRRNYARKFKTFDDCLAYCEKFTKSGYESEFLNRYRFEKFSNFLKSNGNLFASPSSSVLLFATSLWLKRNSGKVPALVDFGGACGESVILLSKIFDDQILSTSWVCESPQVVNESNSWEFARNINFESDLKKIISSTKIDIFFTSGTIQSLRNPYKPLEIIATTSEANIVALTRNNFSSMPSITAQASPLSANGQGEHIFQYGNPLIFYPNTTVIKTIVCEIFLDNGYKLALDTQGTSSGTYGKNTYPGDLVFTK